MPVFEYRCLDCLSVFEHVASIYSDLTCLSCRGGNVVKSDSSVFAKIGGCGSKGSCSSKSRGSFGAKNKERLGYSFSEFI